MAEDLVAKGAILQGVNLRPPNLAGGQLIPGKDDLLPVMRASHSQQGEVEDSQKQRSPYGKGDGALEQIFFRIPVEVRKAEEKNQD
jgi:hypothetical protein